MSILAVAIASLLPQVVGLPFDTYFNGEFIQHYICNRILPVKTESKLWYIFAVKKSTKHKLKANIIDIYLFGTWTANKKLVVHIHGEILL